MTHGAILQQACKCLFQTALDQDILFAGNVTVLQISLGFNYSKINYIGSSLLSSSRLGGGGGVREGASCRLASYSIQYGPGTRLHADMVGECITGPVVLAIYSLIMKFIVNEYWTAWRSHDDGMHHIVGVAHLAVVAYRMATSEEVPQANPSGESGSTTPW